MANVFQIIFYGKLTVYADYFYDTSVIFSNPFITYREPFTICISHDRRTDVIGIDWVKCIWGIKYGERSEPKNHGKLMFLVLNLAVYSDFDIYFKISLKVPQNIGIYRNSNQI